jgi:hypothetical protein
MGTGLLIFLQKQVPQAEKCLRVVERGRCLRLITLLPSVSRLSRQCGILKVSQHYRLPWLYFFLLTEISIMRNIFVTKLICIVGILIYYLYVGINRTRTSYDV